MHKQNNQQNQEQGCQNLMGNCQRCNALKIHDHNAGDQGNALAKSHKDFQRRNLPCLLGGHGVGQQNQNTGDSNGDVGCETGGLQQPQQDADCNHGNQENPVFVHSICSF